MISYPQLCQTYGLAAAPHESRIAIVKSQRRLVLLHGEQQLAEIPIIVGRQPVGHKQREGDERTPEGDYYICYRNPESRFHRFLGLSYPSAEDAADALAQGVIDQSTHDSICSAIEAGKRPDWYTPLGGEVGIHGGGIDRAGTAGCIAMDNEWIECLWEATCLGTPVSIRV